MAIVLMFTKKLLQIIEKHWLVFTTFALVVISILTLYPADYMRVYSSADIVNHSIAYAALAFPVVLAKPKWWLLFIFAFFIYGGALELIQPYVNRQGQWLDLGANALGLVLGFILAYVASQLFLTPSQ